MQKQIIMRLLACCLLPAAAHGQEKKPHPSKEHYKPVKVQYGVASFYSNKFEGRLTYTDEIFSQKKLSAASNTIPMKTWVRVINLRNQRSVVLRINDKMHPHNRRLIDLSRAAAHQLGYTGNGLTRVKVEVLGRKRPPEADVNMVSKEE
jgi:rare lipoprotein A